jgi:hypothetical protein
MLQETPDKFLYPQCTGSSFSAVRILVGKGDLPIIQCEDAPISKRHTEDVGRQILESRHAIAHRLAVNDPIMTPDFPGDLVEPTPFPQCITEFGTKEDRKRLHREKESLPT